MRIFLTGGTGFLGSHFLKAALDHGHDVVALRREGKRCKHTLNQEPLWINGKLDEIPDSALHGCEVLVHLAAHGVDPSVANWEDCFKWNVEASLKLWLQAAKAGVRRFVISGSCFEYGSSGEKYEFIPTDAPLMPTGPYHASKAAATMAALGFAVDQKKEVIVLRPFHIYGEGESAGRFWPSLVKSAQAGLDFFMTKGDQIRDFTHVSVVAQRFLQAVTRTDVFPQIPVIENVGSGKPQTLLKFAQEEWQRLGAKSMLLPGTIKSRDNEVMRYVPEIK